MGSAGRPSPSYRYDYEYVRGVLSALGAVTGIATSGEEKQLDFYGKGTVLVQSSEDGLGGRSSVASVIAQLTGMHQNDLQQISREVTRKLGGRS